jgi:small conductance mechanosensitive channel
VPPSPLLGSALTCDKNVAFDSLCQQIAPHDPTGVAGPILEHLLSLFTVFLLIFVAGRILRRFVEHSRVVGVDLQVRTLVRNVVNVSTYVFACLGALVAAGVNISVLLTFGGLFSLAIGLAFQDVLRNLLSGMFLLVEKPFRLGDFIRSGDQAGVVENIQLRTTTLRTPEGRLAVLPNLNVFTGTIVNQSSYKTRRFVIDVRVPRQLVGEELLRRTRSVLLATKELARKPAPMVMVKLDAEEPVLQCRYWLDYKSHDPDAIEAELGARLAEVVHAGAES